MVVLICLLIERTGLCRAFFEKRIEAKLYHLLNSGENRSVSVGMVWCWLVLFFFLINKFKKKILSVGQWCVCSTFERIYAV